MKRRGNQAMLSISNLHDDTVLVHQPGAYTRPVINMCHDVNTSNLEINEVVTAEIINVQKNPRRESRQSLLIVIMPTTLLWSVLDWVTPVITWIQSQNQKEPITPVLTSIKVYFQRRGQQSCLATCSATKKIMLSCPEDVHKEIIILKLSTHTPVLKDRLALYRSNFSATYVQVVTHQDLTAWYV